MEKNKKPFFPQKQKEEINIPSSLKQKTYTYIADSVTDFAWFADKRFIVKTDTIQLPTHFVKASCYVLPENAERYAKSIKFTKNAIRFYSQQFGEYPFPTVNVVSAPQALKYLSAAKCKP